MNHLERFALILETLNTNLAKTQAHPDWFKLLVFLSEYFIQTKNSKDKITQSQQKHKPKKKVV